MKTAILVPLYRPGRKHLLLIKSLLSAARGLDKVVVCIVADGPHSDVCWQPGEIERLLDVAWRERIDLRIFSFIAGAGYPGVYQKLVALTLLDPDVEVMHFVDQDDYCLRNRFLGRVPAHTQASGVLVVDENFCVSTLHAFGSLAQFAPLETPAPGMTFSICREVAATYVECCRASQLAAAAPHDFVVANLAARAGLLEAAPGPCMLYVQHATNTIGHSTGLRWIARKLTSLGEVFARVRRHAAILDRIHGGRHWTRAHSLHRLRLVSFAYRVVLLLVPAR